MLDILNGILNNMNIQYIQYSYVMNRAILLRDRNYRVIFTNSELNRLFRAKRLPKMACVNFYNQAYSIYQI